MEWPDNSEKVLSLVVDSAAGFKAELKPDLLNGIVEIKGTAKQAVVNNGRVETGKTVEFTAIPYYAWANRGAGDMTVWIATNPENSKPLATPTIASTSKVSASELRKSIFSINDLELPDSSNDHSVMYYHWWPKKDCTEWIEYNFDKQQEISQSSVYWFDDGPWGGCRIPQSWRILYKQSNKWIPVKNKDTYLIDKNKFYKVSFDKVKTNAVRIEITLQKDWSSGIYEWEIK